MNQSLAATDTRDPLLRSRAHAEAPQIEAVRRHHAERVFLAPWVPQEPVGREQLQMLAHGAAVAQAQSLP